MTAPEVLSRAADLARSQPTTSAAICEALKFTDRWLPGSRVLSEAEHCDEAVSVAIVLGRRCARPADVAAVFTRAAGRVS